MKKLLGATLAIAMGATCIGALAACNTGNDAETVNKAITSIRTMYLDAKKETPKNYTVVGQVKVDSTNYDVNWTVNPAATCTIENFSNYVSVGTMDETSKLVTVSIAKTTQVIDYQLTATVTIGSASDSITFDRYVPEGKDMGDVETQSASLSFAQDTTCTVFTADQQVFEANGVKLTNDRAGGSAIQNAQYVKADTDHVRLYKNSAIKIEYPGLYSVIFHATTTSYASDLQKNLEAANIEGATIKVNEKDVTLELDVPVEVLEFTASVGQVRLTSIDVEGVVGGATDAQKLAVAKSALSIRSDYYAADTYDLPATQSGATVTWEAATNDYASIDGGKLKITSMPADTADVVLTATLKVGEEEATKEITIKLTKIAGVEHSGSQTNPYTAKEAKIVAARLNDGATDTTLVYVKGYVVATSTYDPDNAYKGFQNLYIADTNTVKDTTSADAFYVYGLSPDSKLPADTILNSGDYITVSGYLQNYKPSSGSNVQELTSAKCIELEAVTRTDEDIVADALEVVDLSKKKFSTEGEELTLSTGYNGATYEWAVTTTTTLVKIEDGKLKIVSIPDSETTITITVTVKSGDVSQPKTIEITLAKPATFEAGTYTLSIDQKGLNKTLYFIGTMNGYYGATSETSTDAADVEVAVAEGGYTLKVASGENSGKYIAIVKNGTHINFVMQAASQVWTYNAELETFTVDVDGTSYCLGTSGTFNTVSPQDASKVSYPVIFTKVETLSPDASDQEKVDAVKESLTLKTSYEAGEVTLTTSRNGVTVEWEVTAGSGIAEIEGNKLVLKNPASADADANVTVKATIKSGDVTEEKTFNLTVTYVAPVNYGTLQAPLSVTEALNLYAIECPAKDNVTKQVVYMTGKVVSTVEITGSYYQNIRLADLNDSTKDILVFRLYLADGVIATPVENDVLVICGYMTNYLGTTPEFANKNNTDVYLESHTLGTSEVKLGSHEGATVSGLPESGTATNGTEVSFTVTIADGKELVAVKVNGTAITADNVTYKFTVAGNATVTVETKDVGQADPESLSVLTFTKAEAFSNDYTSTKDFTKGGMTWTIVNFNSNSGNGGWDCIKCGRKQPKSGSGASVATITTKTEFKNVITKVDVTIGSVTTTYVNSFKLLIADDADFTDAVEVKLDIAKGVNTFNVPESAQGENKYYRIVVDCAEGTSNGFVQLDKVELVGYAATTEGTEE